jgi:hypothetical protein
MKTGTYVVKVETENIQFDDTSVKISPLSYLGEVYSIQHYVIKFVSNLRQVDGFLRVLLTFTKASIFHAFCPNSVVSGWKN